MPSFAIQIDDLGKRYHISGSNKRERYRTLRDTIADVLTAPARRFSSVLRGRSSTLTSESIWALKGVGFDVKAGEVIGLIGRNGAGKSTLLKILSRITEPTTGFADIHGRVGSLLEVGTGFHPELTGRENIYLNGAILGMKRTEINRKFDEILQFAEVEKFLNTPVKYYSSGMYLRLAFAVAAHLEPEILLVDEVLAVGDAVFQKKCLGKMQNIADEGRTVVFVSHNMTAVQRLCTRAILLDNGGVIADGSVQQVVGSYMQSGMHQLGERLWHKPSVAPGNEVVRLRAVRALNDQGSVASQFKVTEPLSVEVEFWVLAPGHQLEAGFYFYNEGGDLIFVTGEYQDETWQNRTRPLGIHRSRCHVPANLLNEGRISVLAAVSTNPHTLHAIERDAISLQILDDLQPGGARGTYTREWPGGAVRPLMQWTSDFEPSFDEESLTLGNGFSKAGAG